MVLLSVGCSIGFVLLVEMISSHRGLIFFTAVWDYVKTISRIEEEEEEAASDSEQIFGNARYTQRYNIAPLLFPQLYTCNVNKSNQSKQDEFLSQAHEDEWLYERIFSKLPFDQRFGGTFLEIGALDGRRYSNTWYFEKKWDWRGILIEGHPTNSVLLRGNQSSRQNCAIFTAGVCNLTHELLPGSLLFTERGREFGAAVADASPKFLAKWHKNRTDGEYGTLSKTLHFDFKSSEISI